MAKIVLAFDIETSGPHHDLLGIGASVVDNKYNEIDSIFLPCYIENETNFDKKCYDEFWSKNLNILEKLKVSGSRESVEKKIIKNFQEFRFKYNDAELVSDNPVFDGGFMNRLIAKYYPNDYVLPYDKNGNYRHLFDVHSQQRGLLFSLDPKFALDNIFGYTKKIRELLNVNIERDHDHNPVNDAYNIACDQQILFNYVLNI